MLLDPETCYRAVSSRDKRFDGRFVTAVRSTGIYCRPSCPARTPSRANVSFHPTAAAAQRAGFRACKRCLPDATPGSPEWDVAADVAGRAMRLIADGVVDRDGVPGLAERLGYSQRQLHRILTEHLGAGPLALARSHRAQISRSLLETTDLPVTDVAFAAGFASVRQFNQTMQEVYAASPKQLRGRRAAGSAASFTVRIGVRTPYDAEALLAFLAPRAVPEVELVDRDSYARTLALPHGPAVIRIRPPHVTRAGRTAFATVDLRLSDVRDTASAVERARRLLDADCDPVAVDSALAADPLLFPLVARHPGLRVPGHVDGNEVAVRAVLGQQVTVVAARTTATRLVSSVGQPLPESLSTPGLTRLFPTPATLAALPDGALAMPRTRADALRTLMSAAGDDLHLDRGQDRSEVRARLLGLRGIGPWTAGYIALRALGDPDVFLPSDVGVRHATGLGPRAASERARAWRPWRSYALLHLWHTLIEEN